MGLCMRVGVRGLDFFGSGIGIHWVCLNFGVWGLVFVVCVLEDLHSRTKRRWGLFQEQWENKICCVNLNSNHLEFNMNFWQLRWPVKMTCLHLASNPLRMSGWAKLFFSLAKLVAPPPKNERSKELNDTPKPAWPIRFLEIQSPEAVFCDTRRNGVKVEQSGAEVHMELNPSPNDLPAYSFPEYNVQSSKDDHYEQAVGIITQFITLPSVAQDLFKNDIRDLVRCFISSQVFDRMRILNQHMFFICLRDILWQM